MKKFFLLLLILCFVPAVAAPVYGKNVAVIMSADVGAYKDALEGFRISLQHHRIVAQYNIQGDIDRGREALAKIRSEIKPHLIFAVGITALQLVADQKVKLPVVYAMVFNPSNIIGTRAKNVTGASMNVSVDKTFKLLKQLGPKLQRVGVVYNPAKTGYLVEQAKRAIRETGIQLISRQIQSSREAIKAVESLQDKIDALWILPDETILASEVTRYMLLFSYRNKVPLLGLSERQTEMGALLSLSHGSNKDIGRQAGEMANRILRGTKPARIPYTTARQVKLTVNLKAARKLGIEIPKSIWQMADNVVKAPVYKDGDWWVFRFKEKGNPPVDYHVTYKNGKFESDDPDFLAGLDFPPLVSVNLNDPQRRDFEFPLVTGKKWSFQYPLESLNLSRLGGRWRDAEAKIIGPVVQPVKTQAGKFTVIEIRRSDTWETWRHSAEANLIYFYSPETNSVVKLTGNQTDASLQFDYEIELINYGHKAPAKKPLVKSPK